LTTAGPKAVRSRQEIEAAIGAFTDAEWARLRLIAKRYAGRFHMRDDDLLQEAFRRALEEDGKKCPVDVEIIAFLAQAMRSIANDEKNLIENQERHVPVIPAGSEQDGVESIDPVSDELNAEERAMLAAKQTEIRIAIKALFKEDMVACDLLDGIVENFSAEELRELTGLDKVAYASKRRFMRRTIDKHFPDGLPS
jgi:DNA-directed RNA polymerase specialized sigma24 family protein